MNNPFKDTEYEDMMEKLLESYQKNRKIEEIRKRIPSQPARNYRMPGWICPKCGRGLSPLTSSCSCVPPSSPIIICSV